MGQLSKHSTHVLALVASAALVVIAWQIARAIPASSPEPRLDVYTFRCFPTHIGFESTGARPFVHMPFVVALDAGLVDRSLDAWVLPYEREVEDERPGHPFHCDGRFEMPSLDELHIVFGDHDGRSGRRIELTIRREIDPPCSGTRCTCDGLVLDVGDVGPPCASAVEYLHSSVELSTLDWTPGAELFVHCVVGSEPELRESLARGFLRLRVPQTTR